MEKHLQLAGKTIAITGSSKGIGKETALLLQNLGANLVLGSRSNNDQLSENVLSLHLDVTDEQSVKNFYERAVQQFGTVDVLINSAGVGMFEPIIDSSTDHFDQMILVNLRGTYLTCKYFGKHMAERGKGQIINLVSIAGTTALPGCGGYSASKFGVLGLTKVLQAELRQKGVQVTAVLPGAVNSSFWETIEPKPDVSNMIPTETVAKHLLYLITQPPGAFVDEITIMPPLGIL
ncbi:MULTISPECIES: SDR family oxidoreductase [Parageobacillus]|jgi:3-oxoacyl-[acyl-carrier protein] reductase|uniref:3-oxoacyl-ACP reductase n=1 Tax=Parageobacillus thermoglucosidasius TaxID=1426 RepID=A0A1B7KQT3_PARTM|nr:MULTISPECIES: SDR family oxidoreductase [Parageobacillus]OAT72436.1 3-oxoacyl-ACP reductase [Parageobacillus thermoglucosidasius]BDG45735.1 short-chain dehydrogenase [Parageobacillus sp. KH3-4]